MIAMNLTTSYMRLHSLRGSEQMITKVSLGCKPWCGSAEEDEGAWGPSQGTCLTVTR